MYEDQVNMLKIYENTLIVPGYFTAWLSGFIEAEGCFRVLYDKRRNMTVSG